MPLHYAVLLSAVIAALAWLLRALTRGGAMAATAVGASILSLTGWPGCAVLGAFFVTSTVVSRLAASTLPATGEISREARDSRQVLANGAFAAIGAVAEPFAPGLGLWLVTVTLAAAASDTWATAVGSLSRRPPRDILSGRPVAPGTSGGVTWFGTSGGLIGASLVGLVGAARSEAWSVYVAATGIGVVAMVVDSVLGSALQGRFYCDQCNQETERRVHRCGVTTRPRRGWQWLDNDGVNAMTTGFAAVVGLAVWAWR